MVDLGRIFCGMCAGFLRGAADFFAGWRFDPKTHFFAKKDQKKSILRPVNECLGKKCFAFGEKNAKTAILK